MWLSEVGRTSCTVCINAYSGAGRETPCGTCRPELKKVNVPYFTLFHYCQDQVILSDFGPYALNGLFINEAMKDFKIHDDERIEFSLAVRKIANTIFVARAEEAERKRNKK